MRQWIGVGSVNPVMAVVSFLIMATAVLLLVSPWCPLALAPGLALIICLVIGRWPDLGLYMIVTVIPFANYRGLTGELSFVKAHWMLGGLLLVFLIFRMLARKGTFGTLRSRIWLRLLLFLVVSLLSLCLSPFRAQATPELPLLIAAYLFIAITMAFLTPRGFVQVLPTVLVWSVAAGSTLGILGHLFGGIERAQGGALGPNSMALMILYVFPLLFYWMFHVRTAFGWGLVPVLIVLNVIGLVTTWSRGGAVIFLVTLMAIVVEYRDRFSPRTLGLFLGGAGVAVVVVLLLIPPSYWERQKSVTDTTDVPMARRGAYLSLASEVVPKHPVLGWGPDSFQYLWAESSYARKYQRKGDVKLGFRRKAHNTYIEVIVGTGVLGLAAFLSILGCAFRDFTKARRIHLERGNRAMAHLVGSYRISLFALCVYLFVYSDVYHKYLLLSLALSQVALRLAEQGAGATPDDRLPQVV